MSRKSKLLTEEIVRKIIDADKHMIFHISGEPDLDEGVFHFEMRSPDDAELKLRCLMCIMQDYLNSECTKKAFGNPMQKFVDIWKTVVVNEHGSNDTESLMFFSGDDVMEIIEDTLDMAEPELQKKIAKLNEENENLKTTVENLKFALSKLSGEEEKDE